MALRTQLRTRVVGVLVALVAVMAVAVLQACSQRDPSNPFNSRYGSNTEAPFGNGAQVSDSQPP